MERPRDFTGVVEKASEQTNIGPVVTEMAWTAGEIAITSGSGARREAWRLSSAVRKPGMG